MVTCQPPPKNHVSTHVCVLVVAVGGQENLGHFVHSAEEERQLPLEGRSRKASLLPTENPQCVCVFEQFIGNLM